MKKQKTKEDKIKILVSKPTKKTKEYIKNELKWYDAFYKEMLVFEGCHLSFDYKQEKYVEFPDGTRKPEKKATKKEKEQYGIKSKYLMRPKVEQVYFDKDEKDDKKLKKWFKDYANYENDKIEIDEDKKEGITFEMNEKDVDDFVHDLDRSNFKWKII
jgi:hypothetical protein